MPVEELGEYTLALSIVTPIFWMVIFDAPVKIISGILETKNLFVVLMPGFIVLICMAVVLASSALISGDYHWQLLIFSVSILKFTEIISEIEFAVLRKNILFKLFSLIISVRYLFVYMGGATAILLDYEFIMVIIVLAILSSLFAIRSIVKLINLGWYFKIDESNVMVYMLKNKALGFASGLKFFGSNLMRYFVAFQFGVAGLGYLVPVFYGLTALSNISTIFDHVLSPRIVKKIAHDELVLPVHKIYGELSLLFMVYAVVIVASFALSEFYYGLFFKTDADGYHFLINIFSIGWLFFVLRAILKVISYRFNLQNIQVFVQTFFSVILLCLLFLFHFLFDLSGIAWALVLSNILICIYYLLRMSDKIRF